MTINYNIVGTVLFSQSLSEIRQKFESLKKDRFAPSDRIVIRQDIVDEYLYVDAVGTKLIEIQKIINLVDISNCFILLVTANTDISYEIDFVTKHYSVDSNPMEFMVIDGEYTKTIKKYTDTACQKLWNHLYVGPDGNVNPCCLADHGFPLGNLDDHTMSEIIGNRAEKIRSDMTQGYRNRACAPCYKKEDSGIKSGRQCCDPSAQTLEIKDIDIRVNNICNFKCRMCSEYSSSAIQQETIELYGKDTAMSFEKISLERTKKQTKNRRLEKILPFVTTDLQSIYFAGGEPLIMAEHYAVLDQLIMTGNTGLAIRYNTNLSTLSYKNHDVIDYWKKFSNITVGASIDASGAVAEYMRHGTVWNDIVNNILAIKKDVSHVKIQIESSVSNLTIENLIDLQTQWIDQGLFQIEDFRVQVVVSPNFLSPAVLPSHHKDRLSAIIQTHIQRFPNTRLADQWRDVLQWMNGQDYTFMLKDFAHRTRVLDIHRKESFTEIFPGYKDLV